MAGCSEEGEEEEEEEEASAVLLSLEVDLFAAAICQAGIPGRAEEELKAADKRGDKPSVVAAGVAAVEAAAGAVEGEDGVEVAVALLDPCSSKEAPGDLRLNRRDLRDLISFWRSFNTAP